MFDIQPHRFDFYLKRLALVEHRIFSHASRFERPKLNQQNKQITTVYNIHSILGREKAIWVYGILTQKEDTHYYLEDSTQSIKVNFSECVYADPEAFFTENCVLLVKGTYSSGEFMVLTVQHPPLNMNKSLNFKLKEADYFGAYNLISNQTKVIQQSEWSSEDMSLVLLNQVEFDNPKSIKALEKLCEGLEAMRPRIVVVTGRIFTEHASENDSFDRFKSYVEQLGNICKDKKNLLELTEWVFVPSIDDPG